MGRFIDLTGRQFGRLTVLGRAQLVRGKKPVKPHWLVKCSCDVENKGCPLKKMTTFDRTLANYTCNGIDRKDNSLGYIESNCLPCCMICNHAKEDLPYDEFITNLARLVSHQESLAV